MKNKLISFILIIAIALQSLSSYIIIAGYELNKSYITKTFCENKSKPMLHCNGKCHLQKVLKQEDKKEQSPSALKEKTEVVQVVQNVFSISFEVIIQHPTFYPAYLNNYSTKICFSFFHPPQRNLYFGNAASISIA